MTGTTTLTLVLPFASVSLAKAAILIVLLAGLSGAIAGALEDNSAFDRIVQGVGGFTMATIGGVAVTLAALGLAFVVGG